MMLEQNRKQLEESVQTIPVTLPNGMLAYLMFQQNLNGDWDCTLPKQSMIDLLALLRNEELKQEYVTAWEGDPDGPSINTRLIQVDN